MWPLPEFVSRKLEEENTSNEHAILHIFFPSGSRCEDFVHMLQLIIMYDTCLGIVVSFTPDYDDFDKPSIHLAQRCTTVTVPLPV